MKKDMPKPFSLHPFFYFFPISSLKLFPLSYYQKSLMKSDTFDSKSSPSSSYTYNSAGILSCSYFAWI